MKGIDINCDMAEGFNNEAQLMPYISSCNISCGAHAGTRSVIEKTIALALQYQVKIGAHPSYPDKMNFGRKKLAISLAQLNISLQQQLRFFTQLLQTKNAKLHHIKPHGALYNAMCVEKDIAQCFLDAIQGYKNIPLYLPHHGIGTKMALAQGFKVVNEAFADRNYTNTLNLVSRAEKDALITDPKKVLNHIVNMVKNGWLISKNDKKVPIIAETFCLHSDTPKVLKILTYLQQELPNNQLTILRETV